MVRARLARPRPLACRGASSLLTGCLLWLCAVQYSGEPSNAFALPATTGRRPASALRVRGGSAQPELPPEASPKPKDYTKVAIDLFNGIRVPSFLLAGSVWTGSFALPLEPKDTFTMIGMVKRMYVVVACAALCSQLVTIMASTFAIEKLSKQEGNRFRKHTSPTSLLQSELELEWVATKFNFIVGLILFGAMLGCRAWLSILCPQISKVVVCMICSTMAFICGLTNKNMSYRNIVTMGFRFLQLVIKRSIINGRLSLMVFASMGFGIMSVCYLLWTPAHLHDAMNSRL